MILSEVHRGRLLTAKDMSEIFGISISTLYTKISRSPEDLPPKMSIKGLYWDPDTVEEWLQGHRPITSTNGGLFLDNVAIVGVRTRQTKNKKENNNDKKRKRSL